MAILKDSYNTGDDTGLSINTAAGYIRAQTWTATGIYIASQIKVKVYRVGDPGTVTVALWDISGGDPDSSQASGTFVGGDVTTNVAGEWVTITLDSSVSIVKDTVYAVILDDSSSSASNQIYWRVDNNALYAGGIVKWSADSGSTWNDQSTDDLMFEIWGELGTLVDKTYSKKLVAIAGNQIFYQTDVDTMSILSDATEDIDTIIPLNAVEAFQKLFIANQTNLKVADFINTKITTADVGSHPPDPGTILTSTATGNPSMVVDYISSTTADVACTIYGKRTTSTAFGNGETVEGTDDDTNSISFTTSAAETAPPHWYNWTVFGADSAFGTMPSSAYLVCRYRGRLVLSGDPNYPHQWYMSKIGFPFNFLYGTNDPMSAVAGTNADAGELGDIVRALIPFGDDFLVFACANSIHLLDGDPVSGGSIDELDNETGIFGPRAWCIDGVRNLWFYGTGGLYKMTGGRTKPINISQSHLPKLVTDWAAVPGTHRVVLTYDPFRNGIIISRTTLADGTNLNYYYDFKTEGFYPETYPTACGIFSSAYYDSDVATTKGLVLGCNDGYIRNFYDADKNDDIGTTNRQISSYVTWPIEHLAEDNDKEGKLTSLTVELAGGGSGGDFSDTDEVDFALYKGDDAETVLEAIKDGDAPFTSGTLSGTGRKARIRTRVRGAWLGLKFYNLITTTDWATATVYAVDDLVVYSNIEYVCMVAHTSDIGGGDGTGGTPDGNPTDWTATSAQTWAINRVFADIKPAGRIK